MSEKSSTSRWLALKLAKLAGKIVSSPQRSWAEAMRNELEYMTDDRQALAWASGCVRASIVERLQAIHVPDGIGIRILLALPLAFLTFHDLFATVLTGAYRMGALNIASGLGGMTPGDDYKRLIPLMENIPLWLHGFWTAAAAFYGFTIARLAASKQVSCLPVISAIALEMAAELLGRPIIEAIGVRANPNPSLFAELFPLVLPLAIALYLWKMKGRSYV